MYLTSATGTVYGTKVGFTALKTMKLITEEITNVQVITEGKGANKKLYIEGTFLQGEIKNRNGRMYPISTLAK